MDRRREADDRPHAVRSAVGQTTAPLWKRLVWMVTIWTSSVIALGLVAGLLKLWIG